MRYFFLGFMACWSVAVFAQTANTTVSKFTAPVAGVLAAEELRPRLEQKLYLYFNVTALDDLQKLTLKINLPADLEKVKSDDAAEKTFSDIAAEQTVTLALAVQNLSLEPQTITASAIVADSKDFVVSKAFILTLNEYDPRQAFSKENSEVKVLGDKSVRLFHAAPQTSPASTEPASVPLPAAAVPADPNQH